ncbi:MAG TPA: hypothetical protein VFI47_07740 [Acidimicrobiales bacterium]|nr:hypothetical protein [Acidimicrobiales bacterium]
MPVTPPPSQRRTSPLPAPAMGDAAAREPDRFVAPPPTHCIVDAPPRSQAVLRGLVVQVALATWVGGPVLEVTIHDGTGGICLAFLGRRRIDGVEPGRLLTAAGTIGCRAGRPIVLDPYHWLHAWLPEAADA